jgi:hypothetical protein
MSIQEKTSLIIVGSGTSLLDKKNGNLIDSYDDVVRFNDYKIKGFEESVGTKTTIWFNVNKQDKPGSQYLKKIFAHSWDEDINKCPVYNFFKGRSNIEKLSREVINKVIKLTNGASPSTGLLAIYYFLQYYETLTITGFDWWNRQDHHYYGKKHYRGPNHKPEVEKVLIDGLIEDNRVIVL